jgi:hypothetical protein
MSGELFVTNKFGEGEPLKRKGCRRRMSEGKNSGTRFMMNEIDEEIKKLESQMEISNKLKRENLIYHFKAGDIIYPHPKQRELLAAWGDPRLKTFTYTGKNQGGKTMLGVIVAYAVMFGEWPWSGVKLPLAFPDEPRNVMYVGQGWETHIKTTVEPELKRWWPLHRGKISDVASKNNQSVYATWRDPVTKSMLQIMSNMQEAISFEGGKWDLIIWDEPPERANRVAAARGLMRSRGRELFVATLVYEAWIHREIIKARLPDGSPDPSVYNVLCEKYDNISRCKCGEYIETEDYIDNCYVGNCPKCGPVTDYFRYGLTMEGVRDYIGKLKKDEIAARIDGRPSYLSGLVLPKLSRSIHTRPRLEKIPLNWIFDISIDFHPSKPWAILFMGTDPKNFKYLTHHISLRGGPNFVGDEIIKFITDRHLYVNSIEIDPLSKGDQQAHESTEAETTFRKLEAKLASYGYTLETASKDKTNGIAMVNDLLMTENEMPGLFIFEDMGPVIEQLEDWMFDEKTLLPSKKDDEWCELTYRLVLRNTIWYDHQQRAAELHNRDSQDGNEYDPLKREK